MPTSIDLTTPGSDIAARYNAQDILTYAQRAKEYRNWLQRMQEGRKWRLKWFLLEKRDYFRGLDSLARRKRSEDIDLMCRYYNGDQYGAYDDLGNYEDQRQIGDFAYSIPVLTGHVDQAFLQLLATRPEYEFTADDKDDPSMMDVADMVEDLAVKDFKRLMKSHLQSEIYFTLWAGESYRYLYWAPNAKSPKLIRRLKYKTEKIAIPPVYSCQGCERDFVAEDAPTACPACGTTYIKQKSEGGETSRDVPVGEETLALGENRLHIPHPMSMQRDMSALTPEDSSFLIERSILDKHIAEHQYQGLVENSVQGLSPEMMLRYDLERSSTQTDAIIGSARGTGFAGPGRPAFGGETGASNFQGKVEQERHFWEASQYAQFWIDQDETLPDGAIIKGGQFLGDQFPSGIMVIFVGDTIMEIKGCTRGRKWSLVQYGKIAGTNQGAGMKILIPMQDVVNDDFNMGQAVKNTVGHPMTAILGNAIYELPGVGQLLKVSAPGTDDIKKAVEQFPGQMLQDDGTQERVNAAMQFIGRTNTLGMGPAGAPDMKAAMHLATGIAAMTDQAARGQSGAVDQRMLADEELLFQIAENIQEYCGPDNSPEHYRELVERFGPDTVQAFFNCRLRQSLSVGIKPGTNVPKSMALTQANQEQFAGLAKELIPFAKDIPWVTSFLISVGEAYGFPLSFVEGTNDKREVEYRLNKLTLIEKRMLKKAPQMETQPEQFAQLMYEALAKMCAPLIEANEDPDVDVPRVFLQNHDACMDALKDAVYSEQAKSWSVARKYVILMLWVGHYKAKLGSDAEKAKLMSALMQQIDPESAAEAKKSDEQKIAESLSIAFKDLPPEGQQFVLTEILGMPPSPSLQRESAGETADDTGAELEKTQAQMDLVAHNADVKTSEAERLAQIQTQQKGAEVALEDSRDAAAHQRETERMMAEQKHEREESDEQRRHEAEQSKRDLAKQRLAKAQRNKEAKKK